MKINTLLILALLLFPFVNLLGSPLDSIQELPHIDNPEYIGYRMALVNLSVSPDKSKNTYKITFTAINTGRKDLLFGKKISKPPQLVINFDHSLMDTGLSDHVETIRTAVINENFHIAPGKIAEARTVKVKLSQSPKPPQEVFEPMETNPQKPGTGIELPEKEEQFTAKAAPMDDFENALLGAPAHQYDENACSDLVFESIKVVKKSKGKVTLEYTIINNGEGPAKLVHSQKQAHKNLAFQAYLSSKDKITKSSFSLENSFIEKGLKDSNGKLYPGQRFTGTVKINVQKMTKFTPFVILELDPYLSVHECDKTNNKLGVQVGEGIEKK